MATGVTNLRGIFQASAGGVSLPGGGWTPITLTNGEVGAITIGQVCYIFANGTVKKALSNGTLAQAHALAICKSASIGAGLTGSFVLGGVLAGAGAAQTFAALGYLGATAGAIVGAPNLTTGQYNVILGTWINATDFEFAPQFPILN